MTALRDYSSAVTQPTLTGAPARHDEVVAPDGTLRPAWRLLAERAVQLTGPDLQRIGGDIERFLANDGVTYTPPEQEPGPWRLDAFPLVIEAAEWAPLEVGLAQRTELLNAILVDLYGPQRLLSSGVLPPAVVFSHRGFLRVAARASTRDRHPLLLAAADLGRNAAGDWQVLADRAQAPSGIGFAMENRRVISRVLPELYRQAGLHRMAPFFQALRATLIDSAPGHASNPRVVVLSPGTHSETAYDQAFIASSLGFPLVEGSDLVMRQGAVWMRVFDRLERVDVILRRVDADWSDALELRKGSQLGVSGLSEAVRRGTVRVVNGLGAGVLENPGMLPYMSAMCELLLDEPLRLPSVQTYWTGDPRSMAYVLDHLDGLMIRSIDGSVDVDDLPSARRAELIRAEPHRFVGQELLPLSQSPTLGDRGLQPSALTLRTFTLRYGSTYRPLVGGLATVQDGSPRPSSKDVWVLKDRPDDPDQGLVDVLPLTNVRAPAAMVPRVLEDMFWFGRYAERAEDMLRLVLTAHASAEDFRSRPHSAGGASLAVLMSTIDRLSPSRHGADELDENFRSLLLDVHRPGSVAQSISALRDAAQSVRDQLSPDAWQAFSWTERASATLSAYRYSHQVSESAGQMLTGILSLQGVTANMMRDPAWRMICTGRAVERGLQLCHLLGATTTVRRGIDVDRDVNNAVLVAAESAVTHRRRYRGYVRVSGVLDLLLADVDNPRSLAAGIAELRQHLSAMPGSTGSTRPERLLDDLAEELDRADLALLTAVEGERRPHLDRFLTGYLGQLTRFADAVGALHFAPGPVPRSFGFATVSE
ncbi:circularly permuted type 2 ATP-grasp protein [Aeromicrobium wangtongii]|uniref:Circularly permuted type 2 ATP-grasp protein n=1 Tax=Aeromicrobium wangtongii TaxID=2969247 RepID=A0ABY5M609_9ACTN|nr:circularly permuted type 2 ATP-grasp protein [Aeromicrobium wangtongii]MCD9198473.1 circularly permuted type 2 ATP-grasp protein [Aeromicrobium wangtongii]UUP12501.1 circularly permuted type 2 ATP-grasp protein [Aeromicrobium wangtongii]